ncbi:MAG: signal recognition particle-docking protein FtsY [Candidatus Altiarchaeota archaeon]|nr:signal recognition particle-docking protein FtsY [Candidatus Altiarchaeota archaeon]
MFEILRKKIASFMGTVEDSARKHEVELSVATKVRGMLSGAIRLSDSDLEDVLWNLQLELMQNDVASETVEYLTGRLKERLVGMDIEHGKVNEFVSKAVREVLLETLSTGSEFNLIEFIRRKEKPVKIVFFGVNGTGKTTTIAKVAAYLLKNGISPVIAAGDTFRAGAIEQAEKHAGMVGVRVVKQQKGSDSAAVIFDAIEHAKARGIDVVLADTAGRMQTNVNLMDEMKKIIRVAKPDLKIFVGDALTGNDAVEQARSFNDNAGIDAVILTKMDADAKGGSALSITHETKKPIILIGTGQGYGDLKEFDRNWFVDSIIPAA